MLPVTIFSRYFALSYNFQHIVDPFRDKFR